jgi:hypothetical protein
MHNGKNRLLLSEAESRRGGGMWPSHARHVQLYLIAIGYENLLGQFV